MTWNDDLRKQLSSVISPERPLGPPDGAQITRNVDVLRILYDPSNRIHKQAEDTGAPYVIGRKGAGKTAFVTAPKLSAKVKIVELPSADLYQSVRDVVSLLAKRSNRAPYVEQSARLWRHVVWRGVLAEIANGPKGRSKAFVTVRDFVATLADGDRPASPEKAIGGYVRRLIRSTEATDVVSGLGDFLESISSNGIRISEAIEAGQKVLAKTDHRYVVIVDSLEQYSGTFNSPGLSDDERATFEGLFRFIGEDGNAADRSFDIRFAFPAEMWTILRSASAAPVKDFHRRVIAHWSARELLILVATRLATFLCLHEPELFSELRLKEVSDPLSYDDSRALLQRLLPTQVVNGFGLPEDPVAYFLRHTQLLPRHLITLMNDAIERQSTLGEATRFPISSRAIVEGIRQAEAEIVYDVFASFQSAYPKSEECCTRIIPNLGLTLPVSELHRQFNQTGIRKQTGLEFREFQRMLVEIGCLGIVRPGRSTGRYTVGEFEYTHSGALHVSDDDELCLHPIFAEVFGCRQSTAKLSGLSSDERKKIRPIYPYGSDPEDKSDYRDDP